jgi:cytoskeletal protein RodZ
VTVDTAPAPQKGEGFGRYLAQQRELRGLSLEQISDATKLSLTTLRALEGDDAKRWPERVFLVGAVRAYSKAVGLSPEETILRLHEALGTVPDGAAVAPAKKAGGSGARIAVILVVLAAAAAVAYHFAR